MGAFSGDGSVPIPEVNNSPCDPIPLFPIQNVGFFLKLLVMKHDNHWNTLAVYIIQYFSNSFQMKTSV